MRQAIFPRVAFVVVVVVMEDVPAQAPQAAMAAAGSTVKVAMDADTSGGAGSARAGARGVRRAKTDAATMTILRTCHV